jgi:serine/threonine protein kinase
MIHFDLEPENIFLGDPVDQDDTDFSNYSTVKMADFGLAQVTGARDPENPSNYRHFGTLAYRPPVSYLDRFSWQSDANYDSGARCPNGSLETST